MRFHFPERCRVAPSADAPRDVHRAYAARHGYFWLPCPVCGREYGGHEDRAWGGGIYKGRGLYRGVCGDAVCVQTGRTLSAIAEANEAFRYAMDAVEQPDE